VERLIERVELAQRALRSLAELRDRTQDPVARDAAIQRFEYSFEALWKATRAWLLEVHGIDEGSPKGVIRSALKTGILSPAEAEAALAMADDRNLTVHICNEPLAMEIASRLWQHHDVMKAWLARLEAAAGAPPR
jgi:nucleotidyltransferase substrate binding protein (TIGR01987 family)